MDRDKFAIAHLPYEPRAGMREWINDNFLSSELGRDLCIFARESVPVVDEKPLSRIMMPGEVEQITTYRHAAVCHCTACGEDFVTGWIKNAEKRRRGIKIFCAEDGTYYDGYIPEDADIYSYDHMEFSEGDLINCPYCDAALLLTHRSRLRNGRKHRLMILTVEVIGKYVALVTWLATREAHEWGYSSVSIEPCEALVLFGKKICRYSRIKFDIGGCLGFDERYEWRAVRYDGADISLRMYRDHQSVNSRKLGSVFWTDIPDLVGTSGEKTGLYDYIKGFEKTYSEESSLPVGYLKLWQRYPNVENIVKSKWRTVLDSEIDRFVWEENYGKYPRYAADLKIIDPSKTKPHEMLGIEKAEMKRPQFWTWRELFDYQRYNKMNKKISLQDFADCIDVIGVDNVSTIVDHVVNGLEDLPLVKTVNYLLKQEENRGSVVLLLDYLSMLRMVSVDRPITDGERWPKNLRAAHDRLADAVKIFENEENKKKFSAMAEELAGLSYSDGNICIRAAASEQELIDEGKTLHHCVGGYGSRHLKRSDVIFFVRHARRPERSWYTLDINLKDAEPKRVQLHGYQNESIGLSKRLRIPREVYDFCDKWENDILLPWFIKQKKSKKEGRAA